MEAVTQMEAPVAPRAEVSARRELARMFLVLLAITFALRLPALFVPVFNSDETFVATQAHVIEHGGELYEDAADRKPPLVPYLYAATFAFFGTSALWSVRVIAMLAVALTALLLAVEARRRHGARAGWIA
jgi:4-amino-4-deoxy-L-arabinose transferase-like glycosyltransferase